MRVIVTKTLSVTFEDWLWQWQWQGKYWQWQETVLVDPFSLHDGPRRTCNKWRYPVRYVSFKKIFYLHFELKRFVHDIFRFHHSCIIVFLMHNPARFSLPDPISKDCFSPLVFLRNKYLRHKSLNMHSRYVNLSGLPNNRLAPKTRMQKSDLARNIFQLNSPHAGQKYRMLIGWDRGHLIALRPMRLHIRSAKIDRSDAKTTNFLHLPCDRFTMLESLFSWLHVHKIA